MVLLDKLMAQLPEYAMALLGQDDKIALLSRLPQPDLQAILEQPLPEQQLDKVWMFFGPAPEPQAAPGAGGPSAGSTKEAWGPGGRVSAAARNAPAALRPQAVAGINLLAAGVKATNSYAHSPAGSASQQPQLQHQEHEDDQDLHDMLGLLGAKG
eukprot:gene10916-11071_t